MAVDITIKNMPPNLYKKLKTRAAAHRRSVNSEAINCLEKVLNPQHADQNLQDPPDNLDNPDQTEELLARIKDLHKRVPPIPAHFSTDEFLRKAKEEGRP